jgi:transposase
MMKNEEKLSPTALVKEIRRRTRRTFSAEEKIQIVIEGMRGEDSIAAICRKYGIHVNLYYKWNKEFLEAGKRRLSGDEVREASSDEVSELKKQTDILKRELADLYIENKSLKKSLTGFGSNGI